MAILFFLLWIIFNGRVTLEIDLFGIAISVLLTLFICKVFGYSLQKEMKILKNLPIIVEFRSGLEGDLMNVILANSITLTPGTITIFQEKDHFVVHALKEEYAEGIESSSFVTLLRRFK